MIKTKYILFGFISLNSLINGMKIAPYQNIKPNSEAQSLLKIAAQYNVNQAIINKYDNFMVDKAIIIKVTKDPGISPDTEIYYAELADGHYMCCSHFPTGEHAGQVWAWKSLFWGGLNLNLPIDQKNFFILKSHYEKRPNL